MTGRRLESVAQDGNVLSSPSSTSRNTESASPTISLRRAATKRAMRNSPKVACRNS
ncbi:hypothetical protein ABT120_07000 [Nonomuraea angiospora]|uniref:hypothetical protein n=1 Tax=Nonomuraea angiospora TaxID=46172 RepID=UPI00332EEA4A